MAVIWRPEVTVVVEERNKRRKEQPCEKFLEKKKENQTDLYIKYKGPGLALTH
jgi:hypothetical protein